MLAEGARLAHRAGAVELDPRPREADPDGVRILALHDRLDPLGRAHDRTDSTLARIRRAPLVRSRPRQPLDRSAVEDHREPAPDHHVGQWT
jgi:hypothetical protein